MFKWLVKPIISEIKKEINEEYIKDLFFKFLNDEETQKGITDFTDSLFARYKAKAMSSIGGLQAGLSSSPEGGLPQIFDRKGNISLKGLIPLFLGGLSGNKSQEQSRKSSNTSMTID